MGMSRDYRDIRRGTPEMTVEQTQVAYQGTTTGVEGRIHLIIIIMLDNGCINSGDGNPP